MTHHRGQPEQVTEEAWIADGRCRTHDYSGLVEAFGLANRTEIFFPERGRNTLLKEAKAICAACPVRAECLEFALRTGQTVGVYGGKSDRERRRLRHEWRVAHGTDQARCGTLGGYRKHLRLLQPACAPCRAANAAWQTKQRRAS